MIFFIIHKQCLYFEDITLGYSKKKVSYLAQTQVQVI